MPQSGFFQRPSPQDLHNQLILRRAGVRQAASCLPLRRRPSRARTAEGAEGQGTPKRGAEDEDGALLQEMRRLGRGKRSHVRRVPHAGEAPGAGGVQALGEEEGRAQRQEWRADRFFGRAVQGRSRSDFSRMKRCYGRWTSAKNSRKNTGKNNRNVTPATAEVDGCWQGG